MALKQSMKQSMGMTMTPQLQQAIKILQMSMMELQQELNNAMVENPTLEEIDPTEDMRAEERPEKTDDKKEKKEEGLEQDILNLKDDFDWENYINNFSSQSLPTTSAMSSSGENVPNYDQILSKPQTLYDHLLWQLKLSAASKEEFFICEEIVGNLNEDGYLVILVEELAERLEVDLKIIENCLSKVQDLDPIGVGARSLLECLMLQAQKMVDKDDIELVIKNHMHELENKNYEVIAKTLELPLEATIKLCKIIHSMEPKPGRAFHTAVPYYVVPDVYVIAKEEGGYRIVLNDDGIPKMRISPSYKKKIITEALKGDTKKYLKDKMKDAAWLLKSIDQRQKTIYRVVESIVQRQNKFFEEGSENLKPMILKDVANELGLHESTISRVTNNKFVHTAHGVLELKYFFSTAISSGRGETLASQSVKVKIKQLVSEENPKKPLSDQAIVNALKENGIKIARRTVAKYREGLNILPSSKRKKFF